MSQLIIVLDSSVSLDKGADVGPAACFWLAYIYDPKKDQHPVSVQLPEEGRYKSAILMEGIKSKAVRSGAIYNSVDGPTKIFYDGIIRALEACFYLLSKEKVMEVHILGDCEHAIRQLNNEVRVDKMKPMYNQVRKWQKEYLKQKVKISYQYVREEDFSLYKKLDGICKEIRSRIQSSF